ncbi:hypothetical protein BDW66DRAFT_124054 [Aspergillus desertorum]
MSHVKPDQPRGPIAQTSNTPSFAASPYLFSVTPDQTSDTAAGRSSTSITKQPITRIKSPSFDLRKPAEPSPTVLAPQSAPEIPRSQPGASTPLSSLEFNPQEDKKCTSLFPAVSKQSSESIFKAPIGAPFAPKSAAPPYETPTVTSAIAAPSGVIAVPRTVPSPISDGITAQPTAPQSPVPTIFDSVEITVHAEPVFDAQSVIQEEPPTVEAISGKQAFDEAEQEAQRKIAWINSLREAADRRRNIVSTPPSRKRLHEQETPPTEKTKPIKIAKPQQPRQKSMALSSIQPLPKLPILEQIESMTARKSAESKTEPSRPRHVDEDDLLLSAARIAAESLRTGPRLLGVSAPYESCRPSFSPGSSVSSVAFSTSESPQKSPPGTSGYKVSYAPDTDLGLGRSLSRTEQRIRMTGGKGLAYKPLNLTPKNKNHGTTHRRSEMNELR